MMIDVSELAEVIPPLDRALRRKLESVVEQAREIAETAAKSSLQQLGVGDASPPTFLTPAERDLRRRLRSHGRQLDDQRDSRTDIQEIDRLVEEVAYEHWHRMLFARFLAENDLLMYPGSPPVSISLEECEELAAEEGAKSGWELASRFAGQMLPQIFRADSVVLELMLAPEHEQALEGLLTELPIEVFRASDALGWIYQFWQSRRKEEVNASQVKIGARELPSVTQLFTEPYMVAFLLDNSLGAWWAGRQLSTDDLGRATTEEELRKKAAIPGLPLQYLRFSQLSNKSWSVAAGKFGSWPGNFRDLRIIDPCCGSGHFLVAALLMLVPMRMRAEGIPAREAIDQVLLENLYGLEIDRRCVEIAAFALALNSWRYPGAGGYRLLPSLNIACSGLSVAGGKEEWKKLAGGKQNLRIALDWMHENLADAPLLGSLLNPATTDAARVVPWQDLSETLWQALKQEQADEEREVSVVAHGLARAAVLLTNQYHLVVTNVPYLKRGKQTERLRLFCERFYPAAKNDLATTFLERCTQLCVPGGTVSVVLPQNWLFQTTYKTFRESLLRNNSWQMLARLGSGAFETISGEIVKAILMIMSRGKGLSGSLPIGMAVDLASEPPDTTAFCAVDVANCRTASEKADSLISQNMQVLQQAQQLGNPDSRISLDDLEHEIFLSDIADFGKGSTTGDRPRFVLHFWELSRLESIHVPWLNSPDDSSPWSGRTEVCKVPLTDSELSSQLGCRLHGQTVFGRRGVAVNKMADLKPLLYRGEVFDDNICPICPHDEELIPAIFAFVSSDEYREKVRMVDQALKVTAATITKVPFESDSWTTIGRQTYADGLPEPFSPDPKQWIFHGHPAESSAALQVAVARLVGYKWPCEYGAITDVSKETILLIEKCGQLEPFADEDGIVCIPPLRGEDAASERLYSLLSSAYGEDWSNSTLASLLKDVGHAEKSLESWLREKFFAQHCELFQERPFVWHIWDGLRDGFGALINYHKLDRKLLETLIFTYLGDWITRQKADVVKQVDGAEEKLSAAEILKKRLELILEGEQPYDIFVRWKPIEQQPIGWDPDLNDGARINIRPFLTVSDVGKKGAGVLREKPKVNWNKDRGKDITSAPWYSVFNGDRINDYHLTLAKKQDARAKNG